MALDPLIVRTWDCLPQPEKSAYRAMGQALLSGHPFEFADVIRLFFQAASPAWWELRFTSWLANSTYRVTVLDIDGVEFDVILTNKAIAVTTAACIAAGGCPETSPRCMQVNFGPTSPT